MWLFLRQCVPNFVSIIMKPISVSCDISLESENAVFPRSWLMIMSRWWTPLVIIEKGHQKSVTDLTSLFMIYIHQEMSPNPGSKHVPERAKGTFFSRSYSAWASPFEGPTEEVSLKDSSRILNRILSPTSIFMSCFTDSSSIYSQTHNWSFSSLLMKIEVKKQ